MILLLHESSYFNGRTIDWQLAKHNDHVWSLCVNAIEQKMARKEVTTNEREHWKDLMIVPKEDMKDVKNIEKKFKKC